MVEEEGKEVEEEEGKEVEEEVEGKEVEEEGKEEFELQSVKGRGSHTSVTMDFMVVSISCVRKSLCTLLDVFLTTASTTNNRLNIDDSLEASSSRRLSSPLAFLILNAVWDRSYNYKWHRTASLPYGLALNTLHQLHDSRPVGFRPSVGAGLLCERHAQS